MTENEAITKESEEYLEAAYRLQEKNGVARTGDIAKTLHVSLGSVTNTVESLEKRGLVYHQPYRGIKLTEKGRKYALNVLRKHRLAERLMTDILNMKWSSVHKNACQLEHALSPEILQSLEEKLGHPKTCPHGNPIPKGTAVDRQTKLVPLTKLEPMKKAVVAQICDERSEWLEKLEKLRILPGTVVQVAAKEGSGRALRLEVNGASCLLDIQLASVVLVKELKGEHREK